MVAVDFARLLQHAAPLMVFVVTLLLLFGLAHAFGLFSPQRRRSFRRFHPRSRAYPDQAAAPSNVGEQLVAVMAAPFKKRRVLSPSEYRVFKIIEDDLVATRKGYRVFGQTSLGEILQSSCPNAYRSINSKRADILVVDPFGWPILAVEYQGSGHYQGTAAARDAIKKEALRKAGVPYIEISESDSADQIRSRVREQLG
jgi:Protein of unknown function (DUF2726)